MQVDTNFTHKFFTLYSGYRPQGEVYPENFSVELTQPLLDCKEIKLEYASFPNNICPLAGLSFTWVEDAYANVRTSFNYPSTFLNPVQLMAFIETQMNTLSPNSYTYTAVLDATTGLITWTSTGPFSIYAGGITTSGYNLGLNQIADGRTLYPGIPQYYTPLGTTFTSPWPIFNREWGLAIHIRPWSADTCSNDSYLDNHQFVIPLSGTDYGGIVEYDHLNTFKQNISFFTPGHSFKRLFISISRWVDTYNHVIPFVRLNGEILLRFSYTTYRDTQALEESLNLSA
jgi:hypothetical protein